PWPKFTHRLADGTEIEHELFVVHGAPLVVVSWRVTRRKRGARKCELIVRPLLSGRDHHALHHENGAFRFATDVASAARPGAETRLTWQPYDAVPATRSLTNGNWRADPLWYRAFFHREEAARGFEATEDLGSPGELAFDLARGEAIWILGAGAADVLPAGSPE